MTKKRKRWIIIGIITIIVLLFGFQKWIPSLNPTAEILSKEEAKNIVKDRYAGKVMNISLKDDQYIVLMAKNEIRYEIKLKAGNGEVVSFSKLGNPPVNSSEDTQQEEIVEPEPSSPNLPSSGPLTEEEIKKAVQLEVPGKLTLFKKINEKGSSFYKVIVTNNQQKTILKVDASSGEILFRKNEIDKESIAKITEKEAGQIALNQVQGSINDIDLEDENNHVFYLVEIDTPDDKEATIQIDAITGEVLSISFDD
ncbi:PepSY domain-containing protein [Bacillus sp. Bva_UNVM-123]|uniref:PepSY domain-containing protein n=1 Tax=Bacillus sp. Bva_UNVM-123 TaxID=2829798 RepID=UPI00391F8743